MDHQRHAGRVVALRNRRPRQQHRAAFPALACDRLVEPMHYTHLVLKVVCLRKITGIHNHVLPTVKVGHCGHHTVTATKDQQTRLHGNEDAHVWRNFECVLTRRCAADDAFFNKEQRG